MTAELTRRQQEREDTALQYKRYVCGMHGHDYVIILQCYQITLFDIHIVFGTV